jgi:hypothetical protein
MMSAEVERPLIFINNAAVQHPSLRTDWTPEQAAWAAEEIAVNVAELVLLKRAAPQAPERGILRLTGSEDLERRMRTTLRCGW